MAITAIIIIIIRPSTTLVELARRSTEIPGRLDIIIHRAK